MTARSDGIRRQGGTVTKLLLTPAEAAELLGLGRSTVYELLAGGDLESICIGRARRIPRDALLAYVERLRGTQNGAAA
jgi:excisionase family DNA binding protein